MRLEILEETTKYPLDLIGKRMGICWDSDISNQDKNIKRAQKNFNHGRALEFVNIEFVISEVSARAMREISRHVIGVTYLQESTRYVDESRFGYYEPPLDNEKEKQLYFYTMNTIQNIYRNFEKDKVPIEDIANILPLGMHTKVVLKCNLRGLINFMNMRLCTRAYREVREFAELLKNELSNLSDEWKWITDNYFVPKCETIGYCVEEKCCGKMPKGLQGLKEQIRKEVMKDVINSSIVADNVETTY